MDFWCASGGVSARVPGALRPQPGDTILDVGASADDPFLRTTSRSGTRVGQNLRVEDRSSSRVDRAAPGLAVVRGDARELPFARGSFDFVYSHAVIEHVGSREQQAAFLKETLRVARKGVLLTTPNRWHPMEAHTGLPLLHFLPPAAYRPIYRALGKKMYATEETLNLLSSTQLLKLVRGLGVRECSLRGVRWMGIPSNLILVVHKDGSGSVGEEGLD